MGLKAKIKAALGGMTTPQKIVTVAVALLVPLGVWFGIGMPQSAQAIGALVAAEISALVASLCAIFGVTPPQ